MSFKGLVALAFTVGVVAGAAGLVAYDIIHLVLGRSEEW